ncbi:MAG TPA: PfkB family carbohydrate kinase [Gaiellaceae bacterium]|nr:PfkB family carbohydrate kinase [Gaiellaceae bacterium]
MISLLGNLSYDLLPGQPPRVGGGPFHAARALALQSGPVRIYGRCADEDRDSLFAPLVQLGTPAEFVAGESTATFAFSYAGDRREMEIAALGDVWQPVDVPTLRGVTWVHVAPLARSDFPRPTIETIASQARVALDGQGLVRAAKVGPLELNAEYDPELLRHVSVLKLSDEEAAILGDPAGLGVPEVLVTHGSRGATVYADGTVEQVESESIDTDPTGAGDAFCISYVVGRAEGLEPLAAAQRACAIVSELLRVS